MMLKTNKILKNAFCRLIAAQTNAPMMLYIQHQSEPSGGSAAVVATVVEWSLDEGGRRMSAGMFTST